MASVPLLQKNARSRPDSRDSFSAQLRLDTDGRTGSTCGPASRPVRRSTRARPGLAWPSAGDADARGEVEVVRALGVPDARALAAHQHDRRAPVGLQHVRAPRSPEPVRAKRLGHFSQMSRFTPPCACPAPIGVVRPSRRSRAGDAPASARSRPSTSTTSSTPAGERRHRHAAAWRSCPALATPDCDQAPRRRRGPDAPTVLAVAVEHARRRAGNHQPPHPQPRRQIGQPAYRR